MNDLDKWSAVTCGATKTVAGDGYKIKIAGRWIDFSLNDARCREIVREHFSIDTCRYDFSRWECVSDDGVSAKGKTIAEAEIACIKAIKETREALEKQE